VKFGYFPPRNRWE